MSDLRIVIDLECLNAPMPIGKFLSEDEDIVHYEQPNGRVAAAPSDCVLVVAVDIFDKLPAARSIRDSRYDERGWPGAYSC